MLQVNIITSVWLWANPSCLSCSAYPVLPVPFYLYRFPVVFCLSRSACPVLSVPFCMSRSACPILPVPFYLSHSACSVLLSCSSSPVLDVLLLPVPFCLSCSACPVLPVLFCYPVLDVLFCFPCPTSPVLAALSLLYIHMLYRHTCAKGNREREGTSAKKQEAQKY
jgi:hypothetical protein